jgi:radical SAM-linked protein
LRPRLIVRFGIDGDLRFLSHRDTMRLFERALARAGWPVKFTEGFNPRPRLSLPLPRSVGTAGEDEWLIVELAQPIDPSEALRDLARHMPAGIQLLGAEAPTTDASPQPVRVWYEVPLGAPGPELDQAIEALLAREAFLVTRPEHEGRAAREVDIRPFVEALTRHGERLLMVLRVTPTGAARPTEVLDSLGLPGRDLAHRLRRTRVEWAESACLPQSAGSKERTSWNTTTNPTSPEAAAADANGKNPSGPSVPPRNPSKNPNN